MSLVAYNLFLSFYSFLFLFISSSMNISWLRLLGFAVDIVSGLYALHTHVPQILHRDLKSANILVKSDYSVKLCDFGLSRFDTEKNLQTLVKMRGTYAYTAPEVYNHQKYTEKSDLFSFGIILWEMTYRCIFGTYQRPYAVFFYF